MAKIVEFYLTNTGPCTPLGGASNKQIYSFEDLINYTNSYSSSMPYTIELKCVVKTYDESRFVGRHTLGQTRTYKNHPVTKEETVDTYKLFVGDKLAYPSDVAKFVTEQYGSSLDFDVTQIENKPVVFHIHEQRLMNEYDPKIKGPKIAKRFVVWNYLDQANGVFVDRKTLGRITENGKIGEVPVDLKLFFTKTR